MEPPTLENATRMGCRRSLFWPRGCPSGLPETQKFSVLRGRARERTVHWGGQSPSIVCGLDVGLAVLSRFRSHGRTATGRLAIAGCSHGLGPQWAGCYARLFFNRLSHEACDTPREVH